MTFHVVDITFSGTAQCLAPSNKHTCKKKKCIPVNHLCTLWGGLEDEHCLFCYHDEGWGLAQAHWQQMLQTQKSIGAVSE